MSKVKVKVKDVANINVNNFNFNNVEFVNYLDTGSITNNIIDSYKYLNINDNIPSRAKRAVKNNTIVYSSVRPKLCHFGILTDIPENTVVSTGFITLDAKPNINPHYLYNCITKKTNLNYIANIADTSVSSYPSINPSDLENMEIEIETDLIKQNKIANLLQGITKKIIINNKINSELESMAKTLYDYWFLQFEFPNEEGKPYKSSGGKMVWNDELKREIPEGWECLKINELCELYQPKTITENDLNENGKYLVYGANGIVGNYDEFNHKDNQIAICCRGASCGNFIMTLPYSWITGNSMIIKPLNSYLKEYIYYSLSKKIITPFITGSAQPQITRENLSNLKIVNPPKQVISLFNQEAESMRNLIINNSYQNIHLTQLRDFLLPLLMNGQVGFKDDVNV